MLVDQEFRERFGTEKEQQVYQLSLTSANKEKTEVVAIEYIEAYPGEVVLLYAQQLLLRWANSLLKDTEYEDKVWENCRIRSDVDGTQLAVRKKNDGNVMVASLKYMS